MVNTLPFIEKDGRKLSIQTKRFLNEERELQVLSSAAGFYLGTLDDDGWPNSRDSGYYASAEAAQADLDAGTFAPRLNP